MKAICYNGVSYDYEDSDNRYDCFNKLFLIKEKGLITEQDLEIIVSMFNLHKNLPQLEQVLADQGFTKKEHEKIVGDREKTFWVDEKQKKRSVKQSYESFETMWNRSDYFSFVTEYESGDLSAKDEFSHSESDYGRDKEARRYRFVKLQNDVLFEYKEERKQ